MRQLLAFRPDLNFRSFSVRQDLGFIRNKCTVLGQSLNLHEPAVAGLYSNVAEWTSSWDRPYPVKVVVEGKVVEEPPELRAVRLNNRIVRGGHSCVINGDVQPHDLDSRQKWDARVRTGIARDQALAGLGFRCARSFTPRFPRTTNN